jgi:hypothetical protein
MKEDSKTTLRKEARLKDDKVIEAIKILDRISLRLIRNIVTRHPKFVIDYLFKCILKSSSVSGGIKIIAKSRKRDQVKLILIRLMALTKSPDQFVKVMMNVGLVRGVREGLVKSFIKETKKNWKHFLITYGDPFNTYKELALPLHIYNQIKFQAVNITFNTLSQMVLLKYCGWEMMRSIRSSVDYIEYEEDYQNSLFSIQRALNLFDTRFHKSFFSYATNWIKEGIDSSDFVTRDRGKKTEDEFGNLVPVSFIPLEEEAIHEEVEIPTHTPEEVLIDRQETEGNIAVLDYLNGSFPIPNEVRILYRLLCRKMLNKSKRTLNNGGV